MSYVVAGIDVHKKVLMVAVADASATEAEFECRRFGSSMSELQHLVAWLQERGVREAVMESTAQYWKPVWLELEPHFRIHLAQAKSNRAPRGRKSDFGDGRRLVRRFVAGELILSYVPEPVQRAWRSLTRNRQQLVRDKVRLQNQIECLLEEARIKLSSVISDLLGVSGRRILRAVAAGESDAEKLAALGDERLKCTREQLREAVNGKPDPIHCQMLSLYLERLDLLSAGENHNSACPKGNKYLRRVLNQAAQAAVKKKGSYLQAVFRRLLPRLGYKQAVWAIARRLCVIIWKILHDRVRYEERGDAPSPSAARQRAEKLVRALRRLGYTVEIGRAEAAGAVG
jgi:transposase